MSNQSTQNETNKPADTIRDGALSATIWKNDSENGPRYSVDLKRVYTEDDGKTFKDVRTYSGTELFRIARLAERAYDRIVEMRAADKASTDANEGGQ